VSVDYGLWWKIVKASPPRRILVEYVQAGSPAAVAGVMRGAELLFTDGVDVVNGSNVAAINAALAPAVAGETHQLVFKRRGAAPTDLNLSVQLAAAQVTYDPVPVVSVLPSASGNVGYVLFNDHNEPSEAELVNAVRTLRTANIADLVLDLRYNGGGYLYIASQLAYMIAGPIATAGRVFERLQFNSKHPSTDPVTGDPLQPFPFFDVTTDDDDLPALSLPRVYVLTSDGTCSASESIINGLRGIGFQVVQIGGTTCGKPYGFYAADNCGTTYFSIQFRGVNEANFGDYADGFSATSTNIAAQAKLPGCGASDDLAHELGDPEEGQLKVALNYRATGACLAQPSGFVRAQAASAEIPGTSVSLPPEPWRENRIVTPPRFNPR
jgi:hypothetical protein